MTAGQKFERTTAPMANDDKDLPLMSNTDDILVVHYVLFLECNLVDKQFNAKTYFFLKPIAPQHGTSPESLPNTTVAAVSDFVLTLDSKDIEVKTVEEIVFEMGGSVAPVMPETVMSGKRTLESALKLEKLPRRRLHFVVEEWCIKIWKEGIQSAELFPRILLIQYRTTNHGTSITWIKDQDNRDCCFTHGAWINNRSLLPCQEPPTALATWQAFITRPKDALVVMSGDYEARDIQLSDIAGDKASFHLVGLYYVRKDGLLTAYFYTRMALPISTLALAVGFWKSRDLTSTDVVSNGDDLGQDYCYTKDGVPFERVKCRLIAPQSILEKVYQELGTCLGDYLKAAIHLLGPYPFNRLDLVIMPRCFDSLGMANPNITFLSQCLLAGDGSMRVHLAHELAHAWFGLLIGALDWTEEWLSEGFATYLEDLIHIRATKWSADDANDWYALRAYLHYRTLASEIQVTTAELQTLRPNHGLEIKAGEMPSTTTYVKNGMNPEKRFQQVHYLKGYFLLKYLSEIVGQDAFGNLLKNYISQYHGQLVDSKEIIKIFLTNFPKVSEVTVESLFEEWLHNPGLPAILKDYKLPANHLYVSVLVQLEWWQKFNKVQLKSKKGFKAKRHKDDREELAKLNSEQTVLLLELLLEEARLSSHTLRSLCSSLTLDSQNAHIRHRWCELVIKHNYCRGLTAVSKFLTEDQGMGVYLYGELMVSGKPHLQRLARNCLKELREELSPSALHVVQEMLQEPT